MHAALGLLTALLLGAFGVYVAGMVTGNWTANFAIILFLATVVTCIYWIADRLSFAPSRRKTAQALEAQGVDAASVEKATRQPWWLEYTAGLFPVIVAVFFLRSFLFEPFRIPSGSMLPTLLVGDLILVNKFQYGIRLPVMNKKIVELASPKVGDVLVFRFPKDTSVDYIKRVVAVGGDTIEFVDKKLILNGKPIPAIPAGDFYDRDAVNSQPQYSETLSGTEHKLLTDMKIPFYIPSVDPFPFKENCKYSATGVACKVPLGHYFVMGDNRDNSLDSRFWGFVPDENIVGRAFWIWWNTSDMKRFGGFQ
jgi:signal peptidase I